MTTFADVLPVTQLEDHKYSVHFEDDWCIGTVPNGGYVTSAFMLVASRHMQSPHSKGNQRDVINLHLEFMRKTAKGPATFTVRDVKLGSRISNLQLTLSQGDEHSGNTVDKVEGYVTMTDISAENGISLETGHKMLPEPLPVDLPALKQNKDKNYIRRAKDPLAHFRRAGQNMIMYLIRPDRRPAHFQKAMVDQWVLFRPRGREGQHTNDALGFIVDIFPQLIEAYVNPDLEAASLRSDLTEEQHKQLIKEVKSDAKFWYPTLSLNLDVKKLLPQEGVEWLFVRIQAMKILSGRFDLQVQVLDEAGDLVAVSSHASLAVDASRNINRTKKPVANKL